MHTKIKSTKSFIMLWILMLMLFTGSVSMGAIQEKRIIKEYDKFMEQGAKLSRLTILFQNISQQLENYYIFNNDDGLKRYEEYASEVSQMMAKIDNENDIDSRDYLFYLRTTKNMIDNINHLIKEDVDSNVFDTFYNSQIGIKSQCVAIIFQSEKLSLAYLTYSGLHYKEVLENFKNIIRVRNYSLFTAFIVISIWIFRRGGDMLKNMNKVSKNALVLAKGDWYAPDIEESNYYEINNVIVAFNTMKLNIKNDIKVLAEKSEIERNYILEKLHNAEKDKIIKETKLLALQMEINPHFLFNTLNTISRTALLQDSQATITLVEAISNIMRYSLRSEAASANLGDEIGALESYIQIQRLRFRTKLSFKLEVDPLLKLEQIFIPPLILQPIVENSIMHGMASVTSGGRIKIRVYGNNKGSVFICIEDNGRGIDEVILKYIREGKPIPKSRQSKSIGIENVLQRMEYFFGRKGLISFERLLSQGTMVIIEIPLKGSEM
ncbi:sensor histidine kinase [Clostridium lacusfryxellense]|uniref:sensor histidine kinase n=1 Tax=Clostridium lacusfryxellense TaxID=205328 RepID=UPI001C0CA372|nr:histidine kinase [Clostridium lacusfryxellense]MBU3113865.1 histidine kinase [Clostridium lacusfryxellense]